MEFFNVFAKLVIADNIEQIVQKRNNQYIYIYIYIYSDGN